MHNHSRYFLRLPLCFFSSLLVSTVSGEENRWKILYPHSLDGGSGPAVMQTADLDGSDPNIAGLMFRCQQQRIETIVVLVEPLSPRTESSVELTAGSTPPQTFGASVISTGAGVRIAFDPRAAAATTWRNQKDLQVQVNAAGRRTKAVVHLSGLAPALESLAQSCASAN